MTRVVAAFVLALLPGLAGAQTPVPPLADTATLLHLAEQAQRLVTRDRLRLVLRVEAVDTDAARLQAEINRRMTAAVARAASVEAVTVETGGYSVRQENGKLLQSTQWRGAATLSLTARDPAPLLTLGGSLQQDGLLVSTMAYELTPEAARAVEGELTDEAIARLKQRAERTASALGLAVERIRSVRIGNAGGTQPMARMIEDGVSSSSYAAPVAEPGQATVTVSVDAEVVLGPRK
jgi:predicted secreted protein